MDKAVLEMHSCCCVVKQPANNKNQDDLGPVSWRPTTVK